MLPRRKKAGGKTATCSSRNAGTGGQVLGEAFRPGNIVGLKGAGTLLI